MPHSTTIERLQRKTLHLLRQLEALHCDATTVDLPTDFSSPLLLSKNHLRAFYDVLGHVDKAESLGHQIDHSIRLPAVEDNIRLLMAALDSLDPDTRPTPVPAKPPKLTGGQKGMP